MTTARMDERGSLRKCCWDSSKLDAKVRQASVGAATLSARGSRSLRRRLPPLLADIQRRRPESREPRAPLRQLWADRPSPRVRWIATASSAPGWALSSKRRGLIRNFLRDPLHVVVGIDGVVASKRAVKMQRRLWRLYQEAICSSRTHA